MTGGGRDHSKVLDTANEFPFSKAQILQKIKAKERAQHEYQLDQQTMESKIYSLQSKKQRILKGRHQPIANRNERIETEANEPLATRGDREMLQEESISEANQSAEIERHLKRHKTVFFANRPVLSFAVDREKWRGVPHPSQDTYGLRRFRRAVRKVMNSMDVNEKIDSGLRHKSMVRFIGNDISTAQSNPLLRSREGVEVADWSLVILWDVAILGVTIFFLYVLVFK